MSLVEREDVPLPRSPISHRKVDQPRPAASRATPQPLMPPPMMARSKMSDTPSPLSEAVSRQGDPLHALIGQAYAAQLIAREFAIGSRLSTLPISRARGDRGSRAQTWRPWLCRAGG